MKKFKFRTCSSQGRLEVFLEASEPAFLVGLDSEIMLKYGEFDELIPLLEEYGVLERVAIISLPEDQHQIDKLFQSTVVARQYIQDWKKVNNL